VWATNPDEALTRFVSDPESDDWLITSRGTVAECRPAHATFATASLLDDPPAWIRRAGSGGQQSDSTTLGRHHVLAEMRVDLREH